MTCGIYCIENVKNGKQYIGYAQDIKSRWSTHKRELNNNIHDNDYLQNSWNKYGKENFTFKIIEICEKEKLKEREILYISTLKTKRPGGYNLNDGGNGSNPTPETIEKLRNYIRTEEHKKKTSDTLKGRPKSEEWKQKMRKPRTEEAKKSLVGCQIGKYVSPETGELLSILQINKKRKGRSPTSNFVGVSFSKGWWRADIRFNRKQIYVGNFKSEIDAANAFDIAYCKIYNKSFGINFPEIERKEKIIQ